jgi:hypothetical protein
MNNRIRTLYQEARGITLMSPDFMEEWEQKFAELIVRECIEVVNDFGEDVENGDIFQSAENQDLLKDISSNHLGPLVWAAAEHIKKHFGVEL